MTDAVQIFPPGFRVTDDETGAPVSGAKIKVYNAGTTTPKTVYSNYGLSTSLGSTVYTDSMGTPVASSGSSTAVMVYTGTAAYKVVITDADDVTICTLDNIKGALDTSTFLTTGSTSTLTQPVVTKTTTYVIVAADRSKLIECNSTGGQFTITLTAAATLGDNWSVKIRNSGTANQFILAASQNIAFEGQTFTSRAFRPGEGCEIICDGAGFKIVGHQPPLLAGQGPALITITDRVTSDPSPIAGNRYIVATGYGSYATGDIIESNNVTFNKYTPPTDCGWLAYVQDEDTLYQYQGSAWVCLTATAAQAAAGTDNAAFMTALAVRNAMPTRSYSEILTSTDYTTVLPYDDTVPQITEGTEVLTATITPKAATTRVRVTFNGIIGSTTAGLQTVVALFQDAVSNALDARTELTSATVSHHITLVFEHCPATTSAVTYRIRVGPGSAGTVRLNGESGARKFGGIARSTLVVQEVLA